MADLKETTKTEENLKTALAGESQARVKYEFTHLKQKKMVMLKLKKFSKNHLTMKKNMQKYGLNY